MGTNLDPENCIKIGVLHKDADNWIQKYHLNKTLVEDFNDDIWGFYMEFAYHPLVIKIEELIGRIDGSLE